MKYRYVPVTAMRREEKNDPRTQSTNICFRPNRSDSCHKNGAATKAQNIYAVTPKDMRYADTP